MVFLKTEILVSHLLLLRLIFMIYFIILNFKDWFFSANLRHVGWKTYAQLNQGTKDAGFRFSTCTTTGW